MNAKKNFGVKQTFTAPFISYQVNGICFSKYFEKKTELKNHFTLSFEELKQLESYFGMQIIS